MTQTVAERVAAGATLLDTERSGWENELNLRTLNVSQPRRCVLGQLYGGFGEGLSQLIDLDGAWMTFAAAHGFYDDRPYSDLTEAFRNYDELTDAWKDLVSARLELTA